MPLYPFECSACAQAFDEVLSLAEYDRLVACPACGAPATRRIVVKTATTKDTKTFSEKIYPYFDTSLDCVIQSAHHREQVMRRMGVFSQEGSRRTTRKQEQRAYALRMNGNSKGDVYARQNAALLRRMALKPE